MVEFEDNSVKVLKALDDAVARFLEEAGAEVESQAKRNTRVDTGQTKMKWDHIVDEANTKVTIGNPMQNAIWEEFGTGKHAINGDGRKGYWVYVKGMNKSSTSKGSKTYTLQEAKKAVAIMRSKGLDAYYTEGKKPTRALQHAFDSTKNKIKAYAKSLFGDAFK